MFSLWKFVALTVLLSCSMNGALGLKCYFCYDHAGGNPACRTNPKAAFVQECNPENYAANKDVLGLKEQTNLPPQEVNSTTNKKWNCMTHEMVYQNVKTFSRSCAPVPDVCKQKRETSQAGGMDMTKDCCDTDLCNSSFKTNAGLFTLSICLVFVTLLWK